VIPVHGNEGKITPSNLLEGLFALYQQREEFKKIQSHAQQRTPLILQQVPGSLKSLLFAVSTQSAETHHVALLPDHETAAYFFNDVETFLPRESVLFFPSTGAAPYAESDPDSSALLLRAEVLDHLSQKSKQPQILITYPEALAEKVVNRQAVEQHTLEVAVGQTLSIDFLLEVLVEYGFERVDFVYEPGQFSIRGGIIDVFSFANDHPYRIELFGDDVESIRTFDVENQLSLEKFQQFRLLPNVQRQLALEKRESLLSYFQGPLQVWISDFQIIHEKLDSIQEKALEAWQQLQNQLNGATSQWPIPTECFETISSLGEQLDRAALMYLVGGPVGLEKLDWGATPQTAIRKNFVMLANQMRNNEKKGIQNIIFFDSRGQFERLFRIFQDLEHKVPFHPVFVSLHEGFIDAGSGISIFTDHQIFERYHRYRLKNFKLKSRALTLKELKNLQRGDLVVHIDHGIGRYDGLEKLEVQGKLQEAVRLLYRDNDLLYVSISSLHKISKYSGSENADPKLNKLGSDAWEKLKTKTKSKVKDIAKDLILLYAKRRAQKGFAFGPDNYLLYELESNFIYEETPDQSKAIQAVKTDMEKEIPMDRLVCGDVGFGKTEVAIRAAFKAACDGKQVAVLVPTTLLAFQHYRTFSERLADFPVKVDYLNRFRSSKETKEVYAALENGKVDIVIGTHAIVSKNVKFKDLGLLVIDEEQKFGVSVKEKLKAFRVNVDTLTLTATPIPRTLQFSLMGARDFSVINTPPPNRQPVATELMTMSEEKIREAIRFEMARGGQVFFVHNRVKNIQEVAGFLKKLVPEARICVGHGQMEGDELEETLMAFMDGAYDVLLATNIIESGIDISNANTIIINQAQNFGLSDLHQMRGRVGRSNAKAFCYLVVPPLTTLTNEARRRLKAIEEFSDLGSGFNVAMKDLDIRGAGNLLGGEQSGFISEIGFEMYHKILDEAVEELKHEEFKDLFQDQPDRPFVRDCQVEAEIDAFLPEKYINNTTERLAIYMELDNLDESDESIEAFKKKLEDRFGPLPKAGLNLLEVVRLRRLAKQLGIEKLVLKNNKMRGHLVAGNVERFYQSPIFGQILAWAQQHPEKMQFKQKGESIQLEWQMVQHLREAFVLLQDILQTQA
jgi:transcription-repair coupling factor (superfamily II helicase)